MKNLVKMLTVLAALALIPATASAECYADYKAKKDAPLQLHYGVIALPDVACEDFVLAGDLARKRISVGGWTLLRVISLFGPEGLAQRMDSAGKYYLRF